MLSQSDDLSSLSSSPWSSTISSLSDGSAFQLSASLEATSSLAALIEEDTEDAQSEHEVEMAIPAEETVPDGELPLSCAAGRDACFGIAKGTARKRKAY